MDWPSNTKVKNLFDRIFRRDEIPRGTSVNETPTKLAMELMSHFSQGPIIASSNNHDDGNDGLPETRFFSEEQAWSPDQIQSIQQKLTESAGELIHFHTPNAKSVFFAASPESLLLMTGVRITCEFNGIDQPVDLTVIFDEKDNIRCLDFSAAGNNLIFPTESDEASLNRIKHADSLAKLVIYGLAHKEYDHVMELYAESQRVDLNLDSLKDEFRGCVLPSIQWGPIIPVSVSQEKTMVNLSVKFKRFNREPFERQLSLIFNSEQMLESITFFEE